MSIKDTILDTFNNTAAFVWSTASNLATNSAKLWADAIDIIDGATALTWLRDYSWSWANAKKKIQEFETSHNKQLADFYGSDYAVQLWKSMSDSYNPDIEKSLEWVATDLALTVIPWSSAIKKFKKVAPWAVNMFDKTLKNNPIDLPAFSQWEKALANYYLEWKKTLQELAKDSRFTPDQKSFIISNASNIGDDWVQWVWNNAKAVRAERITDDVVDKITTKLDSVDDIKKISFLEKNPKILKALTLWDKWGKYIRTLINKYPKTALAATLIGWAYSISWEDPQATEEQGKTISSDNKQTQQITESSDKNAATELSAWKKVDIEKLKKDNPNLNIDSSVVDTMKALWMNSAMEARKKVYEEKYKQPYYWTQDQNIKFKKDLQSMTEDQIIGLIKWSSVTL